MNISHNQKEILTNNNPNIIYNNNNNKNNLSSIVPTYKNVNNYKITNKVSHFPKDSNKQNINYQSSLSLSSQHIQQINQMKINYVYQLQSILPSKQKQQTQSVQNLSCNSIHFIHKSCSKHSLKSTPKIHPKTKLSTDNLFFQNQQKQLSSLPFRSATQISQSMSQIREKNRCNNNHNNANSIIKQNQEFLQNKNYQMEKSNNKVQKINQYKKKIKTLYAQTNLPQQQQQKLHQQLSSNLILMNSQTTHIKTQQSSLSSSLRLKGSCSFFTQNQNLNSQQQSKRENPKFSDYFNQVDALYTDLQDYFYISKEKVIKKIKNEIALNNNKNLNKCNKNISNYILSLSQMTDKMKNLSNRVINKPLVNANNTILYDSLQKNSRFSTQMNANRSQSKFIKKNPNSNINANQVQNNCKNKLQNLSMNNMKTMNNLKKQNKNNKNCSYIKIKNNSNKGPSIYELVLQENHQKFLAKQKS